MKKPGIKMRDVRNARDTCSVVVANIEVLPCEIENPARVTLRMISTSSRPLALLTMKEISPASSGFTASMSKVDV